MFSRRLITSNKRDAVVARDRVARVDLVRSCRGSTPGGGRTRAPGPVVDAGERRRAIPTARVGSAPPTCPGAVVSSTASVTPANSTAYGAPSTASVGIAHRVVVAAHVVQPRAEHAVAWRGTPRTARAAPVSVRSPFTTTASGSSAAISATAPRPITSGYGGSPGADDRIGPMASVAGSPVSPHSVSPKCTSFAVAIVASRRPAAGRACARSAGSQRSGATPSTASVVLGVGRQARRRAPRGAARWS